MTIYAYIRVSTDDKGQTTENQRKDILEAGFAVDQFFSEDGVSGSTKALDRPSFKAMMEVAKKGDTCICTMVDRLGRTASDVLHTVDEFKRLGIKLRVLQFDGVDVTSSTGKMIITVMAAMAELEKNLLVERTKSGLARTQEQGTVLGAPLVIDPSKFEKMLSMKARGDTLDKIAAEVGENRMTISRNLKRWGSAEEYTREYMLRKEQHARNALARA